MSDFSIYNSDGLVIRTGTCPDGDEELQAQPGEFVRIGLLPIDHFFDPGSGEVTPPPVVIPPPLSAEDQWILVRAQRDILLTQTDWLSLRAFEQGGALAPVWLEYRQALRDITLQPDAFAVTWPTPPEE